MSDDVQQELVDVAVKAVAEVTDCMDCEGTGTEPVRFNKDMEVVEYGTCGNCGPVATAVLAALTARYGEPEIELFVKQEVIDNNWKNTPLRRLVFPWQPVEGDQG